MEREAAAEGRKWGELRRLAEEKRTRDISWMPYVPNGITGSKSSQSKSIKPMLL